MLIRKMLRDVWKNKVPFIAIFLMMFAGNFIFSGITSEYNGMRETFNSYIDKTNLADAWVTGIEFHSSHVDKLKKKPNIDDVEKRALLSATINGNEDKTIDLLILDKGQEMSKMDIVKGEKYSKNATGIWLDASFAKENNYELNNKIKLKVNNKEIEKEIIGLCNSPEYIYNTKKGELVPDHKNNGFVFMNTQPEVDLLPIQWNQLLISGNGDLDKTTQNALGDKNTTVILQKDHPSYSMINDEIAQHKEIGLIFVAVFLFIAVLVTITTVHRLLNSQRLQIGILKAMGFRKKQLYIHYISHSTFICLLGSLAGWCIGHVILPRIIFPIMNEMYVVPDMKAIMLNESWVLPLACALLCLIISLIVCKKYLKGNASKILYSNSVEKKYKNLPLPSLWKRLSFYGQWNMRDIFRNKLRSMMTILGVVGCVALLFASMGLYTSMNYMSDWTFDKVQTYNSKVTGDFSNEENKSELLKSMYGEELMEASIEMKYEGDERTISFTGIESQEYLRLYDVAGTEIELKTGVAISRNTAEEFGQSVGDRIKWRFSGQDEWYLSPVKFIIRTPMTQGITMLRSEMEKENIAFKASSIIGEKPDKSVVSSDYVQSVQYKKDLKSGLDTMLNASITLCGIFLVMAILLGSVILYNLGTLSYMERYRDMATLKVLGFYDKKIQKLMVQQNLWLTFVGIVLGLPTGYGLIILMLKTVQSSIDVSVYTPLYVYVISIFGTFTLSWIINSTLSRKVKHIDMVSALKINE